MSLKAVVEDINAVPEALRAFYTAQDGKYMLPVDGLVPKSKLDEFRANNILLAQERDALRQRFEGIDPEKARELLAKAQTEQDKKLIDAGKLDELVAQRVDAMRKDFETQLSGETSKSQKLQTQLEVLLIDGAMRDAAARAGVRSTAVEDVLLRGRNMFRLVDGKAVPMQGDEVMYGKSGEAMNMDEWLAGLCTSAPHLFEPSRGGGAAGGASAAPIGNQRIQASDTKGFLNNLTGIARGDVRVG